MQNKKFIEEKKKDESISFTSDCFVVLIKSRAHRSALTS